MNSRSFRPSAIFVLLLALAALPALSAEVSGIVRNQFTGDPIPGAIVTVQTTQFRATTDGDGEFTLELPADQGFLIVGAAKFYYNRAEFVDPGATGVELYLEPVHQGDNPNYEFAPPETCNICHPDQFEEWTGSPMAKAGLNKWVDDIYSGLGTPGGMGGFVYLRDSAFAGTNPNSECASCHQPELWIEEPFSAMVDPTLPTPDSVAHGISCEVCHKVADVDVSQINFPGIFPGAVTFTRPEDPFLNTVVYGVLGDVEFNAPGFMRASYQPQLVAEVCGACHQDKNDPDENHTYTGITSEPTYIEWAESPYSDPESPYYATCLDCHMPPTDAENICSISPLPRPVGTARDHNLRGTTPDFLENAVELVMQTQVAGDELQVDVTITNSLTGHHVPTGVTVRNMILLVEAWRDGDDPLTSPLPYTGAEVVHDLGGVGDPAEGYYAGQPGRYFSKVNEDANGNGPTFFTDAVGIVFDNRIPPLGVDASSYTFALPAEGTQIHVRARLIYRRAFRFLVDAKGWTEDGHGNPLEDIAAPHFGHLMESAEQTLIVGQAIPTLSEWGLIIMMVLLVTMGSIVFGRMRRQPE